VQNNVCERLLCLLPPKSVLELVITEGLFYKQFNEKPL